MNYYPYSGPIQTLFALGPCQIAFMMHGSGITSEAILAEIDTNLYVESYSLDDWDVLLEVGRVYRLQLDLQDLDLDVPLVRAQLTEKQWRGHKVEAKFQLSESNFAFQQLLQLRQNNVVKLANEEPARKKVSKRFL